MKKAKLEWISFQKKFPDFVKTFERGSVIGFSDIASWVKKEGLNLSSRQIQNYVWRMERTLLSQLQVWLYTKKGVGYEVLEPREQLRLAAEKNRKAIVRSAKRAVRRAVGTDDSEFDEFEKNNKFKFVSANQSLIQVATFVNRPKLPERTVQLLDSAASQLKVSSMMKESA